MATPIAFDELSFLITDDSAYMRTILRTILSGFGARKIYEAEDGEDGFEKLNALTPDIALIDWEMPGMSGPDMIKQIRNPDNCRHAFVPIILFTSSGERRHIIKARRFGVHEVLLKPVSPWAIYQRVAYIVTFPRPFIRTPHYFGPEPRSEIRPSERKKVDINYKDMRNGAKATATLPQEDLENVEKYKEEKAAAA